MEPLTPANLDGDTGLLGLSDLDLTVCSIQQRTVAERKRRIQMERRMAYLNNLNSRVR